MKTVKGEKTLKQQWSAIRRQITPKIGQLTQDAATIARIVRYPSHCLAWLTNALPDQPDF